MLEGERPVRIHAPQGFDGKLPLFLLLHGYSVDAEIQEGYLQITAAANQFGFVYARADGTVDEYGNRFWNATDSCCNFFGADVDDSTYLRQVLDEIIAKYPIDTGRVVVFGHSNGGFMAHRLACDHADVITAIGSLAGGTYVDASRCQPSRPVHVLQIHGTNDQIIRYEGGSALNESPPYPGARATTTSWAELNGCDSAAATAAADLDLDAAAPGKETHRESYLSGCAGGSASVWTMEGSGHIPSITPDFVPSVVSHLLNPPAAH